VDRVPGKGLMQFSSYVGMRWPLHASGAGKALLAFLPKEELAQTLKYLPLTRLTDYTITAKPQFEQQLRRFQKSGYAWELSEGEPGVACIAAPVFGPDQTILASISIVGTTHQITDERIPALGAQVKHFANAMSARLRG
jgi:DNA-binding IclR family transcriptional regulator